MEKTPSVYEQIAAAIASAASPDQVQAFAERALKNAVDSYDVRQKIEKLLTPVVLAQAHKLLKSAPFQKQLAKATRNELLAMLDSAVKSTCLKFLKKGDW